MTLSNRIRLAAAAAFTLVAVTTILAAEPGRPHRQVPPPAQGAAPPPNQRAARQALKNPAGDPRSPAYVQQMFDAMAIMEAERFLPLSTEQYPGFVQKLRRLQEVRMQSNRRRQKALNDLRALAGQQAKADVTDTVIDAKLKELAAADAEGLAEVRKALDDLDAGLSVRQRARYRLLEENVERRKIDFLTKVRGGGAGPGQN